MNVLVVYETKFGNTKEAAEKIAEGMKEVEQIKTEVINVNDVDYSKVRDFDAIIIGSPTWAGNCTDTIKNFINELAGLSLNEKSYAVFDTNNNIPLFSKAVKKMEKRIGKQIPNLKRILPGLPIRVKGKEGPIIEGELPKCQNFGKEIALNLQKHSNF
jgi:menaquinone-dependent protoporphyrinogen IX oxidase